MTYDDPQDGQMGQTLDQTRAMMAEFDAELQRIHQTFGTTARAAQSLERSLSNGLKRAIDGAVFDGAKFGDMVRMVGQSLVQSAYNAAVRPVTDHFGGMLANTLSSIFNPMMPFANGGSFAQGRVMPFANGGIVSSPTTFPMRGATGLMGEAGPEAIMPLARGADGKLGVRGGGGQTVNVVMHIQTPDVAGFQRTQNQIAARMSRVLGQSQRNR